METSKRIKTAQYDPLPVRRVEGGWKVKGSKPYLVTKKGNSFECECPARTGTCRHLTSVLDLELRSAGFGIVQVWTSLEDAERQHRRIHRITRNGKAAWVTVGGEGDPLDLLWDRLKEPDDWRESRCVLVGEGFELWSARSDGIYWQLTFHRKEGPFCPQVGGSFTVYDHTTARDFRSWYNGVRRKS